MNQQTLWDNAGKIVVNTRLAAAAEIAPMTPNMQKRVLAFVASRGHHGATDEEIAAGLAMRESTARARRVELRDGGQVQDSLHRRRSRAGRMCVVWTATRKALSLQPSAFSQKNAD